MTFIMHIVQFVHETCSSVNIKTAFEERDYNQ